MEEVIAWFITGILVFIIGCVCGRSSHRRTGTGTGTDAGRIRDDIKGATDDNKRLRESEQRTAESIAGAREQNERAQRLVRKARDILGDATHTDGSE